MGLDNFLILKKPVLSPIYVFLTRKRSRGVERWVEPVTFEREAGKNVEARSRNRNRRYRIRGLLRIDVSSLAGLVIFFCVGAEVYD